MFDLNQILRILPIITYYIHFDLRPIVSELAGNMAEWNNPDPP